MRFINRKKELAQLEEYYRHSKKGLVTIAISGLRRVGKTTLIKEFIKNKRSLYFFVYESKTSIELLKEFSAELREQKIITEFESIDSWSIFFDIIYKRCKGYVIVLDEFQNFYSIDKSIFSVMQKYCDENKDAPINLIILGSLVGLFKKIFEDKKQPLYGRISVKLRLNPFTLEDTLKTLKLLGYKNIEEMIKIYSLFGGFPKYYAVLEQFGLINKSFWEIIRYLFIQENAPLENEVIDILKQEFGRRSSLYYSILHSIAIGKTKLSEIAANTNMKESSITRHLLELEEKFDLIKSTKPLNKRKSTRYFISHPLILFWFRFVYTKFSEYVLKDSKQLMDYMKINFNSFLGKRFEEISKEYFIYLNAKNKLPFKIDYIGNWWGSARINGIRKEIEIDLIALNKSLKKILIIECKWSKNIDINAILRELKEKSKYLQWNKDKREDYYCIIAKSFKKKIKEKKLFLVDLDDLEKIFRVTKTN